MPLDPSFYLGASNPWSKSFTPPDSDLTPPDINAPQPSYAAALSPSTPSYSSGPSIQGTDEYQRYQDVGNKLMAALQPNQVSTPRAIIGAILSRRNPTLGSVVTGDFQRQRNIQPLEQQYGLLGSQIANARALQQQQIANANIQSEIQHRGKQEDYWDQLANARTQPPPKGAVDKAIDDLVGKINPDTGKPWEYADAFAHIQDVIQGAKPAPNTPNLSTHTVVVGNRVKQFNPKTNAYDIDLGASPKSETQANAPGPGEKAFDNANATQVTKDLTTARGADFRYRSMTNSYKDAVGKQDQQAMLNLLTNHIGMTLGLQKGARITKDILHEAQASAPWLQSLEAKFSPDGYLSGVTLTKPQMDSMMNLAKQQRQTAWQQAHDSASQAGLTDKVQFPKDFVPEDENSTNSPSPGGVKILRDANGRIIGVQ